MFSDLSQASVNPLSWWPNWQWDPWAVIVSSYGMNPSPLWRPYRFFCRRLSLICGQLLYIIYIFIIFRSKDKCRKRRDLTQKRRLSEGAIKDARFSVVGTAGQKVITLQFRSTYPPPFSNAVSRVVAFELFVSSSKTIGNPSAQSTRGGPNYSKRSGSDGRGRDYRSSAQYYHYAK